MNRPAIRPLTAVFVILAVVLLATLAFVIVALLETPSGSGPRTAGPAVLSWASHEEAASMLGIAAGTCKSQLHRARQLLGEQLASQEVVP